MQSPRSSRKQAGAPAIYVSGFVASRDRRGPARLRRAHADRDVRAHPAHLPRDERAGVRGCGYGLRRRARRAAHDRALGRSGRVRAASRRSSQPKKCGHFAGKELIPAEEMQQKLRAMLAARRDPDFFVVARTDAMGVTDLDDAIQPAGIVRRGRRRRALRRCARAASSSSRKSRAA